MRRVIWPFVIWLLALALPAQGLAAATMLHCAPSRGDGPIAQDSDHRQSGSSHAHHHHDAAAVNHDAGASHAEHHADAAHHTQDSDGSSTALHTCSACAACCIGLGLPSAAYAMPEPLATTAVLPAPSAQPVVFFTNGPERPPRPLLP